MSETLGVPRAGTLRRRVAVRRGRPIRTRRASTRRSRSEKLLFGATLLFVAAALSAVAGTLAGHRGEPYAELAMLQLVFGGVLFARANHARKSA